METFRNIIDDNMSFRMFSYNFSKLDDSLQQELLSFVSTFSGTLLEFWKVIVLGSNELVEGFENYIPYGIGMSLKPIPVRADLLLSSCRPSIVSVPVVTVDTHMEVSTTIISDNIVEVFPSIVEEDMVCAPDADYLGGVSERIPQILVDNEGMLLAGVIFTGSSVSTDLSYNKVLLTDVSTFMTETATDGAITKVLVYDEDLSLLFIQHNCSFRKIIIYVPLESFKDSIDFKFLAVHRYGVNTIESIDFECTLFAIRTVLQSVSLTRVHHKSKEKFDMNNAPVSFPLFSDKLSVAKRLLLSFGFLNCETASNFFSMCPDLLLFASYQYNFIYPSVIVAIGRKFLCHASSVISYSSKVGRDVRVDNNIVCLSAHVSRVCVKRCECGRLDLHHDHDLTIVPDNLVEVYNILASCNHDRGMVTYNVLAEYIVEKLRYASEKDIAARIIVIMSHIKFTKKGEFVAVKINVGAKQKNKHKK